MLTGSAARSEQRSRQRDQIVGIIKLAALGSGALAYGVMKP